MGIETTVSALLRRWSVLAVLLSASACTDQEESIERKCERLREHVVDLRMEGLPEADRAAHQTALRDALGGRFIDDCLAMTQAQITCNLAAKDISDTAACAGASR